MPESTNVALAGSTRAPARGATRVADVDTSSRATVSIRLRRRPDAPADLSGGLSRERFAERYGAAERDIVAVETFARDANLEVVDASVARRIVQVSGTLADIGAAFGVEFGMYAGSEGEYRGREGAVHVPGSLAGVVDGVFGLDERRLARPHVAYDKVLPELMTDGTPVQGLPPTYPGALTPQQVAGLYGFPANRADGQTIGILEFGGGFRTSDVQGYFGGYGLPVPTVTSVGVDGATNAPGSDDYSVETALDISCCGAAAPGAALVVYVAPWSEQGWVDVVTTAVHDTTHRISALSISYGWPEEAGIDGLTWTPAAIQAVGETFAEAAALGISVFVSSGDHGASCGFNDHARVEYPGSDPMVTACGGTVITGVSGSSFGEDVWNEGGGWATGGGISEVVPPQEYQQWSNVPHDLHGGGTGRGVPDIAGNAAQTSGYPLFVNGSWTSPVGGTSAVAPLYAGLAARLNAALGEPVGFLNPVLYSAAHTGVFRDITSGNNTVDTVTGYQAGTGWDACTGLGSVHGGLLLQAVRGIGRPPGLRQFRGSLHLMWKGFERDDSMWTSTLSGSVAAPSWSPQARVDGIASSVGPSLASFDNALYAAWKGEGQDQSLWYSHFDGSSWSPQRQIPDVASSMGPELQVFNGRLYAAWKGAFDDQAIWYSRFDGTSWAPQQRIPNVATSVGPCLATFNNALYAAWKGWDNDEALYFSHFDGAMWAPQRVIPGVWSTSGPALRAYNSKLYAAWKGMDADQGLWYSSFDGMSWAPQRQIPGVFGSVGPALATHDGKLWAVWKGELGDQSMWFTTFDGTSWAPQRQIRTIGGTSPDL